MTNSIDAAAHGRRMIEDGFSLSDAEAEVRRLSGDTALELLDAMLGNRRLNADTHTALTLRGLTVPTYVIR